MPGPAHGGFSSNTETFQGWDHPTLRGQMSSRGPSDTWPAKIRQYWNSLGLSEQTLLTSEDKYRDALKALCTAHKEHNATALLNRIIRQHSPILSITSALDIVNDHQAPGTLTALVLGVSKSAIQVCKLRGMRFPQ